MGPQSDGYTRYGTILFKYLFAIIHCLCINVQRNKQIQENFDKNKK